MPNRTVLALLVLPLGLAGLAASLPGLAWAVIAPLGRSRLGFYPTSSLHHSREAEERHRVRHLPGRGSLDFRLFSGSVPVSKDRALFYALVEAEDKPSKAPVVLWLTGGPGCSSVGTAFLGEHGPLLPRPGCTTRLMRNPYSYHALANMIYLDAPAFVGFSYSNSSRDKEVGDKAMAADVVAFIREWGRLFPELARNPFWLAGESYAGHYIPHITLQILDHNRQAANREDRVDLRGFLLGNPSTDSEYDNQESGRLVYWHSHGLISEDIKREVEDSCDFKEVIITPDIEVKTRKESKRCRKAVQDAISEMGPISIQNVFQDSCKTDFKGPAGRRSQKRCAGGLSWLWGKRARHAEVDPCVSQEVEAYLSRRDVQDALHANMSGQLPWEYRGCTEGEVFKGPTLQYSVNDQLDSMLPLYRRIMEDAPKLRILIYTGDADGLVPLTGTRKWVFRMGTREGKRKKTHWRYWKDPHDQVGGYLEEYDDFTFATIRSGGHEAPYSANYRTFQVYKTWLEGKDLV